MRTLVAVALTLSLFLSPSIAAAQEAVAVTTDGEARGSLAAVSIFGDSTGIVAISGTGSATGEIAASGTGDTFGYVAASGTGQSVGLFGSVSGTGYSYSWLAAVSGTGDAGGGGVVAVAPVGDAVGLVAISALGDAGGLVAISGGGNTSGLVAASVLGNAYGFAAYTVAGDAHGIEMSGSVLGDSYTEVYNCYDPQWRVCTGRAFSVTGNASGPSMPVSVLGDAQRGSGQGLGTCEGRKCYAVGAFDESGEYATVSVLGGASSQNGPAIAVLGDASNCDPDRRSYSCGYPAVSVFGDARNEGPAVSVFGDADACDPDEPSWECDEAVSVFGEADGNLVTVSVCRTVEALTAAPLCLGRPALLP